MRHANPFEPQCLDQGYRAAQPIANIGRQRLDLGRHRRVQDLDGPAIHAEIDIEWSSASSKRASLRSRSAGSIENQHAARPLSDDELAALTRLLKHGLDNHRYPLSPRLRPLKSILNKLQPQPVREPLPPPKLYTPPQARPSRRRPR